MKTIMKYLFAALFFSLVAASLPASPNHKTFRVVNNTSFDLGSVTVNTRSGEDASSLFISGPGITEISVHGDVTSITINDQTLTKNGQSVDITLPSGEVVQATFTGGEVVVTDQQVVFGDTTP
jgi:hypothetical protein